MSRSTVELKHRVAARRKLLEGRLENLRARAAGATTDAIESLERELDEVRDLLRDGWENLRGGAVERLNEWLETDPVDAEDEDVLVDER